MIENSSENSLYLQNQSCDFIFAHVILSYFFSEVGPVQHKIQ